MEPGEEGLPFGEPNLPGHDAWKKLFGDAPPPTGEEANVNLRELEAIQEKFYPAIDQGNVDQVRRLLKEI